MSKCQIFQEIATGAYDMEVMIANHHESSTGFVESKKDKAEFNSNVAFFNNSTKEAMLVIETELSRSELRESKTGREKELVFQGCDKKASYAKRAP